MKGVRIVAVVGTAFIGLLVVSYFSVKSHFSTQRDGELVVNALQQSVTIDYDEWGVPHIQADNKADLYFALGYAHAKDRLFQMELMRRLSNGELAEILGEDLVEIDRLFRTVGLRHKATQTVENADWSNPAWQALKHYLAGVNYFQENETLPVEFSILGIEPRPYTAVDSYSVAGYMAYSFAVGMRTEPVMTYIANELGQDYLTLFDLDTPLNSQTEIQAETWNSLLSVAQLSRLPDNLAQFEGSNAWSISGKLTKNQSPILESDPHISFAQPGAWWEANLKSPGFELYGHFQQLVPTSLLGHNSHLGWGLTMFQNDDMDFYVEKTNPGNQNQIWSSEQWTDLELREESIKVKDKSDVTFVVRSSERGPIINDIFEGFNGQPVSLWWAFLQTENPSMEAFYQMNHATDIEDFEQGVKNIHAPGLNVMYADAQGNIAWWAAAKLVKRPEHARNWYIQDGSKTENQPQGFYDFSFNPQQKNPESGVIISANERPSRQKGFMTPGYYNLPSRADRLHQLLENNEQIDISMLQQVQLDVHHPYVQEALNNKLDVASDELFTEYEGLKEKLQEWDGIYDQESIAATVFTEWQYQIITTAFKDEIGDELFALLKQTRRIDYGYFALMNQPNSPWWNNASSSELSGMENVVNHSLRETFSVLSQRYGGDWQRWRWENVHQLTVKHALSTAPVIGKWFDVGPVPVPGSHETVNNLSQRLGTGEQPVSYGPSTRRLIDFSNPAESLGILPTGQSGNPFDKHYDDQFPLYTQGEYRAQRLNLTPEQVKHRLIMKPN